MHNFPYTNFHELNLDWVLQQVKTNKSDIHDTLTAVDSLKKQIFGAQKGVRDSEYVNIQDYIPEGYTGDITEYFNKAYSDGYRAFYFPEDEYRLKFENSVDYSIKGDGRFKTIIRAVPNSNASAMYISGTVQGLHFEGFTLRSLDNTAAKTMHGFRIMHDGGWLDLSAFNDVSFQGFVNGFFCEGRAIWNVFTNCEFYGNYGNGFNVNVNPNEVFNNNIFYSCRFSNNRNYGITMTGSAIYSSINTVFIGCNIEKNGRNFYEWGDSNSQHCILFTGIDSAFFTGCYFENNAQCESNAVVWYVNKSDVYIDKSSFVIESKPMFNGSGCSVHIDDSYGVSNAKLLLTDGNPTFSVTCNCFDKMGFINTNMGFQVSSNLDFTGTNVIDNTGNAPVIYAVAPENKSTPVYVITHDNVSTFNAAIMASGENFTPEPNSVYAFFLKGSKLYPIK